MKQFFILISIFLITACAQKIGGTDVNVNQTGIASSVTFGTVMSIIDVNVNDDNSGTAVLTTIGGGVAGGFLGSEIGKGSGNTVAKIGGAILGAIAGSEMTKILNNQAGYQLTIRLDDGSIIAIVQGTDIKFARGEKVQIITSNGKKRVLPL